MSFRKSVPSPLSELLFSDPVWLPVNLTVIFETTRLQKSRYNLYPEGLTKRLWQAAAADAWLIEEEDEEPEDYEFEEEDNSERRAEEVDNDGGRVESGPPMGVVGDDDVEDAEGAGKEEDPYTFVVPIAQGWIGDYKSSPTMIQLRREWSPGIFGWPTPLSY
jgi:phage repressor protein C with HTH and peptisase S24 domain